jgi:hypothetical protein
MTCLALARRETSPHFYLQLSITRELDLLFLVEKPDTESSFTDWTKAILIYSE